MTTTHIQTIKLTTDGQPSFTNIPQNYDDLLLVVSARRSSTGRQIAFRFNLDSGSNYSELLVYANGSSVFTSSTSRTSIFVEAFPESTYTANVFSNHNIYISDYTSTGIKTIGINGVSENNATEAWQLAEAATYSGTSGITSIEIVTDMAAGSLLSLYGVERISQRPKATGGIISYDSGYFYHAFTASGTFTPNQSLDLEYVVVAGGGGGGAGEGFPGGDGAGGGGAGGYLTGSTTASAQGYAVTIGAGGAGSTTDGVRGNNGVGSSAFGLTPLGGGGGGSDEGDATGADGGSGGGAAHVYSAGARAGGSGTVGQGNDGGATSGTTNAALRGGAGGGGAGSAGLNPSDDKAGNGGAGLQWLNGLYYAGGGGGGTAGGDARNPIQGFGGIGGGGDGGDESNTPAVSGSIGSGGGGGGGSGYNTDGTVGIYATGANGGSGVVIIRYPA